MNAAEKSCKEISLEQLVQQKGNISYVKESGKTMEDEYTKSLADVTALAKTKNIALSTSQIEGGEEAFKKLNKISGNNFGKEYSNRMVSRHKDAIVLLEKAATEYSDSDIRAWTTATTPTIRKHLNHSLLCEKECEKM